MKPTFVLANRFREVILPGTWIANTNYKQQLERMDWETATRQLSSLNTIAILAQHVHYYIHGLKPVLEGGSLSISDRNSFDFPPIASQQQWEDFLQRFFADAEVFALRIEQMPEDKLREVFFDPKYGNYERNLEGIIEHSYYHLGQIVLLNKLLKRAN